MGQVETLTAEGTNLNMLITAPMAQELKVDQSVAHNGVCLTVTAIDKDSYWVTAIEETLQRTNLSALKRGDKVNLERCLRLGDRLDGHMVQGHVDTRAVCTSIDRRKGSWLFAFEYTETEEHFTVSKGSITVNGVSLTVVDSAKGTFSVAVIPFTFEHTTFHSLLPGQMVNLEFDILGKYVSKIIASRGA